MTGPFKEIYRRPRFRPNWLSEYLNYTFVPSFGAIQMFGALAALIGMLICAILNEPLLAIAIFCIHFLIFSICMLVSWQRWKEYKRFAKNLFEK
jgi:hypothetical protein